ncbi:RcpC/CpaB family pilus assembly protein, partial [Pseudomonas sp. DrBHI1]
VLPALRVLSVDQQTGLANDGRPAQTAEEQKARRDQQSLNSNTTRTVGLAVPEALASRLMLAAQAGTLRLAVRSAEEPLLAAYWSGQDASPQLQSANRDLYRFSQLSQVPLASQAAAAAAGAPAMQIIRGAQNGDNNKTP